MIRRRGVTWSLLTAPGRRALVLGALVLGTGACDQALKIRNVAPRVTAVTEAAPAESGMRVLFWVQDHETDPVDVAAAWAPAEACSALRARVADRGQAPPDPDDPESRAEAGLHPLEEVPGGGGHHTVGLTSGEDFPGVPHELLWDLTNVDAAEVCLYLLPDDRNGSVGEPTVSPVFPLASGFSLTPSAPSDGDTRPSAGDAGPTAD